MQELENYEKVEEEMQALFVSGEFYKMTLEDQFKLAKFHLKKMNYGLCAVIYDEILKANPSSEKAHYKFGSLWFDQGNFEKAKFYIGKALGLAPATVHPKKWMILGEMSEGTDSIGFFEQGIANLALALAETQKRSQGVVTADSAKLNKKMSGIKRGLSQGYCGIADVLINETPNPLEHSAKIEAMLLKAMEFDPDYLEPHYHVIQFTFQFERDAECNQAIQRFMEKVKHLKDHKYEELLEYDSNVWLPTAKVLLSGSRFEDAIFLLKLSLKTNQKEPEVLYNLAYCLFEAGKYFECSDAVDLLSKEDISGDAELQEGLTELKVELGKKLMIEEVAEQRMEEEKEEEDEWESD